tara:strand:- start:831 stop:1112 length:282 start_codon:yes stop_codon:yes gene_type:complete
MEQKQLARYEDRELVYEDYVLIINAKSGHYEKRDTQAMEKLKPYFDKEYIETDRTGAIWLTERGVRMLQSVGCDPLKPQDFLNNYPHMMDRML